MMKARQVAVDTAKQAEIVHTLMQKLKACYVFPEVAEQIALHLQELLAAGELDEFEAGEEFALALTLQMQEVHPDEHLWVRWRPEPLPDDAGPLRENQEWLAEMRHKAQLDNCGFHKAERLPGNVGFLEIRYLHRPAWGGDTAVGAMAFLAQTHALIFDLRRCVGGTPDMVTLLSSYLFGPQPVHLNTMVWRDQGVSQQYWTLPYVPGPRVPETPVYVLTSRETFSGGEEFAYNLQARGRAVLVGETTGGGAHAGSTHRLHPHFEAFIPSGRAVNPVTGTNWEGRGVEPDIAVQPEQALNVAYRLALQSVLERLDDQASGPLGVLRDEARAALEGIESP